MNKQKKALRLPTATERVRHNVNAWILMLPSLVLFAFFVWIPLFSTVRMSFYNVKGTTLQDFCGFDNYVKIAKNPVFSIAWGNTVKYTLCSLVVGFLVPIVIAALITETTHWKGFFRVGVYFPNIIPGIAAMMIQTYFFRAGDSGVLNILLAKLGMAPRQWLNNSKYTIFWIVVAMTWKSAGSTALIYMAGISGISSELYEAATIDGATPWRRFTAITIPSIVKLGKTMLIMQIIAVFQILYEPLMMTNGGPNNASLSVMEFVYDLAFTNMRMSQAAAMSVLVCIALIFLTALYFWVDKRVSKE